MAFSSTWQSQAPDNRSATYYAGVAATSRGVPAGMSRTFRQSDLTDLVVHGRSGEQSGDAQVDVRYSAADQCRAITLQMFARQTLPYALTMHVPAGSWSVGQTAQDYVYGPARSYAARHVYSLTTGLAAWGPSRGLPRVDSYCRCLIPAATMFADPRLPSGASSTVAYKLYRAGRLIAHRTVDPDLASFTPKLPAKGWYLLSAVATRSPLSPLPGNALSPRSSVRAHFYADPGHAGQVGGYITRFRPYGLGVDNRARTKTTTVGLGLSRSSDAAGSRIPVRSVSARMSADGGRTWHSIPVHHANGQWSATVTNPKAGFVYLLANVVDTHGNSTETVVARAYAVG
jgi:hypothetical protein